MWVTWYLLLLFRKVSSCFPEWPYHSTCNGEPFLFFPTVWCHWNVLSSFPLVSVRMLLCTSHHLPATLKSRSAGSTTSHSTNVGPPGPRSRDSGYSDEFVVTSHHGLHSSLP